MTVLALSSVHLQPSARPPRTLCAELIALNSKTKSTRLNLTISVAGEKITLRNASVHQPTKETDDFSSSPMVLTCQLCDTGVPRLNIESDVGLREHLVEAHSKEVAESFLNPGLLLKDRWIWKQISFNKAWEQLPKLSDEEVHASTADIMPPISQVVRTFLHMAMFQNDETTDEQREDVMAMVDKYFPQPEVEEPEELNDDDQALRNFVLDMLSRSTQLSAICNEFPFAVPSQSGENQTDIFGADCEEEESESRENTPVNEFVLPRSNGVNSEDNIVRSTFSKRPIADSKAIRTAVCQSCYKKVCMTARQRHVYMAHVNKKDMFICPQCDYMNSNSIWEARKHCESHDPQCKPTSNEKKYVKIIRAFNAMCFPSWKEKKFAILEEQLTQEEMDEADAEAQEIANGHSLLADRSNDQFGDELDGDDVLTALMNRVETQIFEEHAEKKTTDDAPPTSDKQRQRQTISAQSNLTNATTSSSNASEADEKDERRSAVPSEGVVDRHVCRKCGLECRYPGRHIVQKHLGKPLYVCPVCETFGTYEACAVGKHIESVHKVRNMKPISKMMEYAAELRQLQTECFPDRQMKLVPNNLGGKPRERHICKVCDADVAQSDRQRHVYHRHLVVQKLFECPLCDFHSDYDVHRVVWHIKWTHRDNSCTPVSHETEYREQIDRLNEECFPGWKHRKSLAAQEERIAQQGKERFEPKAEPIDARSQRETSNLSSVPSEVDASALIRKLFSNSPEQQSLDMEEYDSETAAPTQVVTRKRKTADGATPVRKRPRSARKLKKDPSEGLIFCEACRYEISESEELSHIMNDHIQLDVYKCPVCKTYTNSDSEDVQQHMKEAHKNTVGAPLLNIDNVDEVLSEHKLAFPERTLSLDKWQQGNGVQCKECGMLMKTEDRQIHVYRHHLRKQDLYECIFCDFSHHACSSDVKSHMRHVHNKPDATPRANIEKYADEIDEWNSRCFNGWINRRLPSAANKDFDRCRLCHTEVQQTSRHIAEVHMQIDLHQCPLCEYGASEARLVRRHMRNYHEGKADHLEPIANVVARRSEFAVLHEKCFPGRPKRLSNIVISEEGRRTKCKECGKTISRKRRLDHLIEHHLKKKVFKCSACPYSSTHDRGAVEAHLEAAHSNAHLINDVKKHKNKLEELCKRCFKDQEVILNFDTACNC